MKEKVWDNPNKMHFESPHKTFNRQCSLITTGNQIGNVVASNYIRPFAEVECNGFVNPEGHLQEYDLSKSIVKLPQRIKEVVRFLTHDEGGIIYHFRHYSGNRRIDDGFVFTTKDHKLLRVWYVNRDWRAMGAVDEAIKYVTG